MRKNSFIQGALILTVAGIIVKFIGAFSRIYLSRLLGGEGIGLYQMAYPIYLLCLSVSSAGLPVAISIMVAERNALNDYHGGQKVFRISMAALVLTGLFFSVLLFFGAQFLGSMFIMDVTVVCMLFFALAIDKVRLPIKVNRFISFVLFVVKRNKFYYIQPVNRNVYASSRLRLKRSCCTAGKLVFYKLNVSILQYRFVLAAIWVFACAACRASAAH